jgi:hypothetical protein
MRRRSIEPRTRALAVTVNDWHAISRSRNDHWNLSSCRPTTSTPLLGNRGGAVAHSLTAKAHSRSKMGIVGDVTAFENIAR